MKKVITILLLIATMTAFSQGKVTLNTYFDAKLMITGDDHGNDPGTLDLLLKSEWQTNQLPFGYFYVYPQFEYANLEGGEFIRFASGIGFYFNTIIKNIEFSPQINFGALKRPFGTSFSWELAGNLNYIISKKTKVSLLATYTQRQDLDFRWHQNNTWRFSGYVGFIYSIN